MDGQIKGEKEMVRQCIAKESQVECEAEECNA